MTYWTIKMKSQTIQSTDSFWFRVYPGTNIDVSTHFHMWDWFKVSMSPCAPAWDENQNRGMKSKAVWGRERGLELDACSFLLWGKTTNHLTKLIPLITTLLMQCTGCEKPLFIIKMHVLWFSLCTKPNSKREMLASNSQTRRSIL